MKSILTTLLLLFSHLALAETVVLPMNQVLNGEARYHAGKPNKPAVLLLHGFLSTNQFATVKAMESAVQETGASTLAITLTLGINQRKESLRCSSLHTHTLQQDLDEIDRWVNWLKTKGHQEIVLIGHSFGSQKLLQYLNMVSDESIKLSLLTSMFYIHGQSVGTNREDTLKAQALSKAGKSTPQKFSYGFCNQNYFATPESYLSYMALSRSNVLHLLDGASSPVTVILGEKDKTFTQVGENWLLELEETPAKVILIENANHFFSDEYEFDLQEAIIEQMNQLDQILTTPID